MAEGNSGDLGWRAALPPDLQQNELLTPIKEVKDLGAGYLDLHNKYTETGKKVTELEGRMANALFVPEANAPEEVKAAFFTKLGRPAKVEEYELVRPQVPEELKDIITFDDEEDKWFKDLCFRRGLSKEAANSLYQEQVQRAIATAQATLAENKRKKEESLTILKNEWKDKYDSNFELTKRAMDKFGSPELKQYLNESGLGNDPHMIKFFYNIGKAMAEDTFMGGGRTGSEGGGNFTYSSME